MALVIRWGFNSRLARSNVAKLRKRILRGEELTNTIRRINAEVKAIVVAKLQDDRFSTRDPSATNRGFGLVITPIVAAISTGIIRRKFTIVGGVGRIQRMDALDPIKDLPIPRIISSPQVKLWRILEYGAGRHPITARNISIAPEKKQTLTINRFKVKPSEKLIQKGIGKRRAKTKAAVPLLRFFWKKKNIPFVGPSLPNLHPGQIGRGIWTATATFEARLLYSKGIFATLRTIVLKHSRR